MRPFASCYPAIASLCRSGENSIFSVHNPIQSRIQSKSIPGNSTTRVTTVVAKQGYLKRGCVAWKRQQSQPPRNSRNASTRQPPGQPVQTVSDTCQGPSSTSSLGLYAVIVINQSSHAFMVDVMLNSKPVHAYGVRHWCDCVSSFWQLRHSTSYFLELHSNQLPRSYIHTLQNQFQ